MPAARKRSTTKDDAKASATKTTRKAKAKQAEPEVDEDEDEDEDEEGSTSNRRKITEEIAARAVEMREEGAKWSEVIDELGFNGAQLRPHMARLTEAKIDTLEDTPESVAEHREEGYAWYAMAISLGKTVAEVKEMAEEGGADVEGRKYRGNGAEADVEDEGDEDEGDEDEDEDEEDEEEDEEPAPKRTAKKSSTKTASKPAASKSSAKATRRRNPSKAA